MNRLSFLSLLVSHDNHPSRRLFAKPTPDRVDWRDFGVVGPVRKQGGCNSCWAFSAAGSLEYWLKKERPDAEVNVQAVLDCTPKTYGCRGGLMENVFEYGHSFPVGYTYSGGVGKCSVRDEGVRAISHVEVDGHAEESLAYMIHKWGPVAVAVDFSKQHRYKGGVIKADECKNDPHHAVLAVGYTPEYWIVKNSMGTEWGDKGYAYIERGKHACGIDTYASVATGIKT